MAKKGTITPPPPVEGGDSVVVETGSTVNEESI